MSIPELVTSPLGLVAFALVVVAGLFAKLRRGESDWLRPLFSALVLIVVLGGIAIAYLKPDSGSEDHARTERNLPTNPSGTTPLNPPATTVEIERNLGQVIGTVNGNASFGSPPEQRQ
jgi:hypothetical protein